MDSLLKLQYQDANHKDEIITLQQFLLRHAHPTGDSPPKIVKITCQDAPEAYAKSILLLFSGS